MTRVEDRLRATLEEHAAATRMSEDALEVMERRHARRRLARWPLALGLAAVSVAAVAGAAILTAPTEQAGPDPAANPPRDPRPVDAPVAAEPTALPAVQPNWDELTLHEAVDHLIALNEARPAPAPLVPGQERVVLTVGAALHTTVGPAGTHTVRYLAQEQIRVAADGSMRYAERVLAEDVPVTATLDELRAIVADADDTPPFPEPTPLEPIDDPALDEAEALSHGSAAPAPGRTERPDQSYAFMRMLDAFRYTLVPSPEHTIRALRIIRGLDDAIVDYRGTFEDLIGREVVAFAGFDHANDAWMVALFDPETGAFVGEFDEFTQPLEGMEGVEPPVVGSIGALVSETIEPPASSEEHD
ncbi:MAG: hypothetical protein KY469_09350 [Actinobacteria bacterium]|nr:hypothetical protein [Actinomycetota bacterium]